MSPKCVFNTNPKNVGENGLLYNTEKESPKSMIMITFLLLFRIGVPRLHDK